MKICIKEFKMTVTFSDEVENIFFSTSTGRVTRMILSLNIDKFIIDDYAKIQNVDIFDWILDAVEFE